MGHEVTQKAGPPLLWGQAGGPGVVQPGDEKTLGTPHRTLRGLIKKGETDFTQTDSSKKWGKGFKMKEERFKWDIRNKFFTKQWWDTGTGCSKKLWMALCMPFNLGLHAFLLLGTFSWNGSTLSYASLSICRVSGIFQRKRKEGSGTMGAVWVKSCLLAYWRAAVFILGVRISLWMDGGQTRDGKIGLVRIGNTTSL